MIKKAILEIIEKRVKPIDETNQFGLQYIQGVCDIYWEKFASNYMTKMGMDPYFFTKLYTVASVEVDGQGENYIDLPESIIKFPYGAYSNGSEGVVSMYPITADEWDIKPIREGEYRSIKNLEVYKAAAEHYYWVRYDKIYFSDNLTTNIKTNGVVMNLMIPFSKYGMSEDIPLPSDLEQVLVEHVVSYIQGTPLPDLTNDNSDR
jgi:hypothetical protein